MFSWKKFFLITVILLDKPLLLIRIFEVQYLTGSISIPTPFAPNSLAAVIKPFHHRSPNRKLNLPFLFLLTHKLPVLFCGGSPPGSQGLSGGQTIDNNSSKKR